MHKLIFQIYNIRLLMSDLYLAPANWMSTNFHVAKSDIFYFQEIFAQIYVFNRKSMVSMSDLYLTPSKYLKCRFSSNSDEVLSLGPIYLKIDLRYKVLKYQW